MKGNTLGEPALRQINALIRKDRLRATRAPQRRQQAYPYSGGVAFFNDSGETIPANACMLVTGVTGVDETSQYYTVSKPTSSYLPLYLVNRALPIEYGMGDDSFGIGDWLIDPAGRVLVDGTPSYGETWGPASGSWLLQEGNQGFTMQGGLGTTEEGNSYSWGYQVFPATAQNYVEYTLDEELNGFAGTSLLRLDASNLTGWSGSLYRAGSEADVGIEYQTSETAPQTNGLYKATRDGLFRLTITGNYQLVGTTEPSKVNQATVTTGPASAGTAHTHDVVQTGHDAYILGSSPNLEIILFNKKASGGAIAAHTDATGQFFRWWVHHPTTLSSRYVPIHAQWNVCLHENDKVSLRWRAASMTNHYWTQDIGKPKLRFEYIGEIQDWAVI